MFDQQKSRLLNSGTSVWSAPGATALPPLHATGPIIFVLLHCYCQQSHKSSQNFTTLSQIQQDTSNNRVSKHITHAGAHARTSIYSCHKSTSLFSTLNYVHICLYYACIAAYMFINTCHIHTVH